MMMRVVSSLAMVGLLGGVTKAMKEEDRIDGRTLPGWECMCCSEERFGLAFVLRLRSKRALLKIAMRRSRYGACA